MSSPSIFAIPLNKENTKILILKRLQDVQTILAGILMERDTSKLALTVKPQKGQFADGTFLPSGPADLSPLFIISHIKGEGTWEAKHIETLAPAPYLLNIGHLEKFSILGFLLPSNTPITAFQHLYACFTPENKAPMEIPLCDLFLLPVRHIRLAVYPGYDILIFISGLLNLDTKSLEQLERQFGGGAYFSSTFADIDKALPKILRNRLSEIAIKLFSFYLSPGIFCKACEWRSREIVPQSELVAWQIKRLSKRA